MSITDAITLDQPWAVDSLCRQPVYRHVNFFPEGERGWSGRAEAVMLAKAVCNLCPVKTDCLAYAQGRRERFGVWGGEDMDRLNKANRPKRAEKPVPVAVKTPAA